VKAVPRILVGVMLCHVCGTAGKVVAYMLQVLRHAVVELKLRDGAGRSPAKLRLQLHVAAQILDVPTHDVRAHPLSHTSVACAGQMRLRIHQRLAAGFLDDALVVESTTIVGDDDVDGAAIAG